MSDSTNAAVQACLDRLRAGDGSALPDLLRRTQDHLARLARRILRDYPEVQRWEQTDDVLQEALVRLCDAVKAVRPADPKHFFRLCATHVRRRLIDLARRYGGRPAVGPPVESGSDSTPGPSPEPADSTNEPGRLAAWAEFHAQVEALPEDDRDLFDLLWYQDLSQAEAAAVLGANVNTVKDRWRRARRRLLAACGGRLPE
jgi:RNA polymerase sigma-70 factor (ECF subfamily)